MSIINKIKELKRKLVSQSIKEGKENEGLILLHKTSMISAPSFPWLVYFNILFLISTVNAAMADNQPFWWLAASLTLGYILYKTYRCFKYILGCKKTKENINSESYQDLFDELKVEDIENNYFPLSKYNHEQINLIQTIGLYDLSKQEAELMFASVLQEIGKPTLRKLLLETDLILIQSREKNITSAIYIYALLSKVEEFLKEENFEYNSAQLTDDDVILKTQHDFILNADFQKSDLEKIIKKECAKQKLCTEKVYN